MITIGPKFIQDWLCDYEFYYETINEEENKEKLIEILNI